MIHLIRFGLVFLLLITSQLIHSQDTQSDYLQAKSYFSEGNYKFASEYFMKVAKEESAFKKHALFYLALSSYHHGDLGFARSTWRQIETKYPEWKEIDEVCYWLAKVYFDEGNYTQGIVYAKKSKTPSYEDLILSSLDSSMLISDLEVLYRQFPRERGVAKSLANRIARLPNSERNYQLLNEIVQKFNFDKSTYGLPDIGKSQIKNEYKIAVLFPFLFDGLSNPRTTIRNKFVMDLYTGMSLCIKDLNQSDTQFKLYPYDTKRNNEVTADILRQDELQSMDLIVGPLFDQTFRIASDFAYENKINIVNPLSTGSGLVRNNPYAFLFKASIESQARRTAETIASQLVNKNVMIFYEDNFKDSLSAYTYSQRIQELGFEVLVNRSVVDTTVRETYDMLTDIFEIEYLKREADSIRKADPNRVIKERKSTEEKNKLIYYEELFKVKPDSVGHIYIASSKPLYASNYISAIEIRNDTTVIIGRENWLDFEALTYEEMERLGILFVGPDYCNKSSDKYVKLSMDFLKTYRRPITKNVLMGYELMNTFGTLMQRYGNYFQNGTTETGLQKGVFFEGFDFTFSNSNQYVPVLRLKDSRLEVINKVKNDR